MNFRFQEGKQGQAIIHRQGGPIVGTVWEKSRHSYIARDLDGEVIGRYRRFDKAGDALVEEFEKRKRRAARRLRDSRRRTR